MARSYRWALDPNFQHRQQVFRKAGSKNPTPVTPIQKTETPAKAEEAE